MTAPPMHAPVRGAPTSGEADGVAMGATGAVRVDLGDQREGSGDRVNAASCHDWCAQASEPVARGEVTA